MENLLQSLMRNIKVEYQQENNTIKYEEYYFNGIQTPKDIEVSNIAFNSVDLNWKIDNINILHLNNKEIKFRVEMRKKNKKFIQIYEGKENKCKIETLKIDKDYEFKVCSIYNDLMSSWSEIVKMKTPKIECDSNILLESKRECEFFNLLTQWTGYNKVELIYRATRDGSLSNNFHEKCDNQGPTIILCKHEKGYIFGGFASISWTGQGGYRQAPNSFLFTLTNVYGTEPAKFHLKNNNDGSSVYDGSSYGAIFGAGHYLYIRKDCINNKTICNFPTTYQDNLGKGKSIFTGDNNITDFQVKEIEVFKLFK